MIDSSKLMNKKEGQSKFFFKANKKIISINTFLQRSLNDKRKKSAKKRNEEFLRKRKKQEDRLEDRKSDTDGGVKKFGGKLGQLTGATNLVNGFKNAIGKLLFGFFAIRLLKYLPVLKNILPLINGAANFISSIGIGLIDGFANIINIGYQAYDASKVFMKQIGGEDMEASFDKFMGAVTSVIDILLLATLIRASDSFGGPLKKPRGGGGGGFFFRRGRGPRKPKDPSDPKKPDPDKPGRGFPAGGVLAGVLAAALIFAATRGKVKLTPAQALNSIKKAGSLKKLLERSREVARRRDVARSRLSRSAAEAEVKQTQGRRRKVFSQQRVEAEVGGRGGTATSGKGRPSDPERPKYGRGVDPSRIQPEVVQEMVTGKKPTTRSKSGGGRTQPPQQQSTSTSKPGKMQPARTAVKPAILTDKALSNRILSDQKFRNLFLEHLREKFNLRNPQGRITKGVTLDEYAALSGTTTDQLIKSELAKKGPTSFKGRLKLIQQQVVPLKPQIKVPRTKEGFIKPKLPTAEMLQRIVPKNPKQKISFLKRIFGFTDNVFARIPVIGPLVDFGINLAFGDPLPKAATKAIFAAIFGAIGMAAGSVVPGAGTLIGGVLGGLAGDIIGGVLYDMVLNNILPPQLTGGLGDLPDPDAYNPYTDPDLTSKALNLEQKQNVQRATDLRSAIRQGESGGNYSATYSGYLKGFPRAGEDLTNMTISQVIQYQKDYIDYQRSLGIPPNKRSAAVGAYQMLYPERAAAYVGIPLNAKFNKENQDKMLSYYLDMAGRKQYERGEITAEVYNDRLAGQFASLKTVTGEGVYDYDGINRATKSVLDLIRKEYPDRSQGLNQETSYGEQASNTFIIQRKNLIQSLGQGGSTQAPPILISASDSSDNKNVLYMIG